MTSRRRADNQAAALDLHQKAKAKNTRDSYDVDVNQCTAYCEAAGIEAFPATPAALAEWIGELSRSGYKQSSIQRKLYAVSSRHKTQFNTVCVTQHVKDTLAGLKRDRAESKEKKRKARALKGDVAGAVIRQMRSDSGRQADVARNRREIRNRALVLMGFAGGFRVSELLRLDIEDLMIDARGLAVRLYQTKTNKGDKTQTVGIERWVKNPDEGAGELCPVRCLEAWLSELGTDGIASGRIFRSIGAGGAIKQEANANGDCMTRKAANDLLKDAATRAGFDGAAFSTHSMRRGHITQAYAMGVPEQEIAQSVRISTSEVLRGYNEQQSAFDGSASKVRF